MSEKPEDVDSYIAAASPEARSTLEAVRAAFRSAVPEAEEGISWGVPFYKHYGALGGFAVYKRHVSFGLPVNLRDEDREALEQKGYVTGKKTVQVAFDQRVPTAALKRLVKAQARENEVAKAR
ncbi:MAG TPA: DUF1801 domain-containing protein [Acidimicrobiales bacterium]|nr:DUF1801 domain-containing protein [Acidimicrobiales bacterium]